jgi:transcriptional regulator with XRE-family HTH domain
MPQTPRLRYWRERRALTLRELAAQAGVAYATVFRLEHGKDAEMRTLRKLAAALGVEPAELLGDDPGEQKAA